MCNIEYGQLNISHKMKMNNFSHKFANPGCLNLYLLKIN